MIDLLLTRKFVNAKLKKIEKNKDDNGKDIYNEG